MIRSVTISRRSTAAVDLPGLHPVVARVLAARGQRQAPDYSLKRLLPPRLSGLDQAADILAEAIMRGESILVVGDFDADGATGTALAVRTLTSLGARQVRWLVPDRFRHGYGLSPALVEEIEAPSPAVLVTVDQGISSIAGVAAARRRGMQVVVTDHHLPGPELPAAEAIVNPNLAGETFGSTALAGVGVMFYTALALRSRLRQLGWFERRPEPRLDQWLDLVALGTVADLVPLDENNRRLVYQGLARMRAGRCSHGVRALLEVAGRNLAHIQAADLGFAAGPRLNAAGRLEDMGIGIRCLLADSERSARAGQRAGPAQCPAPGHPGRYAKGRRSAGRSADGRPRWPGPGPVRFSARLAPGRGGAGCGTPDGAPAAAGDCLRSGRVRRR